MFHLCKGHIAKEAVSWWGMIVTEEYYWCLLWNSLYTIRPYSATCWWLYGLWWSNGQQWNISISDGIVKSGKCIFSSSLNEDTWHAFHRPQADKLQCWQYQDHDKIKRGICGDRKQYNTCTWQWMKSKQTWMLHHLKPGNKLPWQPSKSYVNIIKVDVSLYLAFISSPLQAAPLGPGHGWSCCALRTWHTFHHPDLPLQ